MTGQIKARPSGVHSTEKLSLSGCSILVVCHESPGTFSGGAAETAGKIDLLVESGASVLALVWEWKPPFGLTTLANGAALLRLPKRGPGRALGSYLTLPTAMAARTFSKCSRARLTQEVQSWLEGRSVSGIILDGIHGFPLGRWLASRFKAPLVYRSHNIESAHQWALWHATKRPRFKILLNALRLPIFDCWVRETACFTAEICAEDLTWNRSLALNRRTTILPVLSHCSAPREFHPKYDIAFAGSLTNSLNRAGLRAFHHRFGHLGSDHAIAFFGHLPECDIHAIRKEFPGVELCGRFERFSDVVELSAVLINPVISATGVNIKSFEALANGAILCSTAAGARGLSGASAGGGLRTLSREGIVEAIRDAKEGGYGAMLDRHVWFREHIAGPTRRAFVSLVVNAIHFAGRGGI